MGQQVIDLPIQIWSENIYIKDWIEMFLQDMNLYDKVKISTVLMDNNDPYAPIGYIIWDNEEDLVEYLKIHRLDINKDETICFGLRQMGDCS